LQGRRFQQRFLDRVFDGGVIETIELDLDGKLSALQFSAKGVARRRPHRNA